MCAGSYRLCSTLRADSRRLCTGFLRALNDQFTQGVGGRLRGRGRRCRRTRRCVGGQALGDQRVQRVYLVHRVHVQHQSVLVGGYWRERKHLWPDRHLQVHHQAHHRGRELADADTGNVGVIRTHLGDQFLECGVQRNAFKVHRQARRGGHKQRLGREGTVGLDRDARVFRCRPDSHGQNRGSVGQLRQSQGQDHAAALQESAALHAFSLPVCA